MALSIFINFYSFSFIHLCPFLPIFIHHHPFSFLFFIHCDPLSSILSTFTNFHPPSILINLHPFSPNPPHPTSSLLPAITYIKTLQVYSLVNLQTNYAEISKTLNDFKLIPWAAPPCLETGCFYERTLWAWTPSS